MTEAKTKATATEAKTLSAARPVTLVYTIKDGELVVIAASRNAKELLNGFMAAQKQGIEAKVAEFVVA